MIEFAARTAVVMLAPVVEMLPPLEAAARALLAVIVALRSTTASLGPEARTRDAAAARRGALRAAGRVARDGAVHDGHDPGVVVDPAPGWRGHAGAAWRGVARHGRVDERDRRAGAVRLVLDPAARTDGGVARDRAVEDRRVASGPDPTAVERSAAAGDRDARDRRCRAVVDVQHAVGPAAVDDRRARARALEHDWRAGAEAAADVEVVSLPSPSSVTSA